MTSSNTRHDLRSMVGDMVASRPVLSAVFDNLGIDYCCAGRLSLGEACKARALHAETVLAVIDAWPAEPPATGIDQLEQLSLVELVDHIERTHHAYLRSELPKLEALADKVASAHGGRDARLQEMFEVFITMSAELVFHMQKEEQVLFPMIRSLEASAETPSFHCGTIDQPIDRMDFEHAEAGSALRKLRRLSDNYRVPQWACGSYRHLLESLARIERDLHQHMHKESNILYPRALALAARRQSEGPA